MYTLRCTSGFLNTIAFTYQKKKKNFVKSLNANFLVLIPKKEGVKDLRNFRLISLESGFYKWLAKVLANSLKKMVGKVVSTT